MAAKRLNKNLVIGLTLCGFCAMIALSVLMLQQLRRRDPQYFVDLAQRYEGEREWESAALFYWKAWERSHDVAHLVSYGDMQLNDGELGRALGSLRSALVNQPDSTIAHVRRTELLLELAKLYRKLDDWERVREAAETFLDSEAEKTSEQEAFARNAQGLALIGLGRRNQENVGRGEAALRRAVELAPDQVAYALDEVNRFVNSDRIEEGERAYADLLSRHSAPGAAAARVRVAYAEYLASRQRSEEAGRYFQDAVTLAQSDATVLLEAKLAHAVFLTAQWSRARGSEDPGEADDRLFDQAEEILRDCMASDPDAFDLYLELVVLYGAAERHSDVVGVCDTRIMRGFSRTGVAGRRNQLQMFSLMVYAATACTREGSIAKRDGDPSASDTWLDRAEQYLADARGEFPSHPRVLSQAGRINLVRGRDRQALDDLRAAEESYRSYDAINWSNKLLLAQLHLKLNEAGAAKAVFANVLDALRRYRGRDSAVWTLYAQVLFANNERRQALAVVDQILSFAPGHADALRLKAAIFEREGRREEAAAIVDALSGDKSMSAMLKAQQHMLEGETQRGLAVLQAALRDHPADTRLVAAAVRALWGLDRIEEARTIVEHALQVAPDELKLQRLLVLVRREFSSEQRDAAMLEIIESEPDGYQRALELVSFHGRREEFRKALDRLEDALQHLTAKDTPIARNGTVMQHRALLGAKLRVAASLDDQTAMAAARDAAEEFDVDGAGGKSIAGLFHLHRGEYESAIQLFKEAIEAQPTDAQSLTNLGQCLQIVGRDEEARDAYGAAIRVHPDTGLAHKGLASLARKLGDTRTFEMELAHCERLIPLDRWVAARLLERREDADPNAAIAEREALLAGQPDDIDNLKRLAVLCESVKDYDKADRHIGRLMELQPDDKNQFVTASRYFRRTDRPIRSLEVARRYADSRPSVDDRAEAQILVASHYLGVGELDKVEQTLLAAAEMSETFEIVQSLAEFYLRRMDQPQEALPWYGKAVAIARATQSERLAYVMARRIACLLHRAINDTDTAQTRLSELRAAFPNDLEGILLESELHGRAGRIRQAIASLSEYLTRKPDDPVALYQRALHHRSQGRVSAAVEDLQTIKRSSPLALDFRPRLLLVRLLRQSGQSDLSIGELESLVEDAPESADALDALVRAYIDAGRPGDAERIVTAQINRAADNPDARWLHLRGRISMELGDTRRALADFKRRAETTGYAPESVADVLDLFVQLGRAKEGIEYLQRHARDDQSSWILVARHGVLLARTGDDVGVVAAFRRAMKSALTEGQAARASVAANLLIAFPPQPPQSEHIHRAIDLFEAGIVDDKFARSNDRILITLFRAAHRDGEAATRLEALIDSCTNDAQRVGLLFEAGELYQTTGKPQRARKAYEMGLSYDPTNWRALNNLAYLLSDALGENILARQYAERAVALADNSVTLDTLGWICVGLGEYSLAVAELSRAIRLAPDDALAYFHLGEAYRRNGQFAAAKDVLTSGLKLARTAGNTELANWFGESHQRADRSDDAQ